MRFLHIEVSMRTNIEIDDKLMSEAMKSSGALTKKAAVEEALRMMVKIKAQEGIQKLFGIGGLDADYNHKAMRISDKWDGPPLTWAQDAVLPRRAANALKRGVRKKAA
jgi:Arc/MetJ family transcription regulator